MRQKFFGDFALLRRPHISHRVLAFFYGQCMVTLQEFFGLNGVVGEGLGGSIDGGETAADDDHWQAYLHIGNRVRLCGAGEL